MGLSGVDDDVCLPISFSSAHQSLIYQKSLLDFVQKNRGWGGVAAGLGLLFPKTKEGGGGGEGIGGWQPLGFCSVFVATVQD